MTINFEALRKSLDELEKVQNVAQKQLSSQSKESQETGRLKMASVFVTLARQHEQDAKDFRKHGETIMEMVIKENVKS